MAKRALQSVPCGQCFTDCCCCCCCCVIGSKVGDSEDEPYGPTARRGCTDFPFIVLFLLFWCGMVAVAAVGFKHGDIHRLDHGIDMNGNMCGYSNENSPLVDDGMAMDMTDFPVLYWPNPLDMEIQLCIKHCPDAYLSSADLVWMFNPYGERGQEVRNKLVCVYNVTEPTVDDLYYGLCFPPYKARSVLGRCMPDLHNLTVFNDMWDYFFNRVNQTLQNSTENPFTYMAESLMEGVNSGSVSSKLLADLKNVWWLMLLFLLLAVVLSWLCLFFLRLFAGVIVWATIILGVAVMLGITVVLWRFGSSMKVNLPNDQIMRLQSDIKQMNVVRILSYVMVAVDFILILVIIFLRNRIRLAVAIIKEASKALTKMPSLTFFPLGIFASLVVLYAYWVVVAMFLTTISLGQDTITLGIKTYQANVSLRYLEFYHLFGLLWTSAFILAIGQTTVAGAVSFWYWCTDEKDFPRFPLLRALFNVMFFHLGSMAMGSLILAIVKFVRILFRYIERKLRLAQNRYTKIIFSAIGCLLWVLERIVKYINRNAYIMIAVKGQNFCRSASRAFILIFENILRVGVVNGISSFLLLLMNIVVVVVTSGVACIVFYYRSDLYFWILPVIVNAFAAFVISSAFTNTYKMAVDTILLSFCEDASRHDGKPKCMSQGLAKFLDGHVPKKNQVKDSGEDAEKAAGDGEKKEES